MHVKIYQITSTSFNLFWGLPQGSLIGRMLYIIGSEVSEENKYKYFDDLTVLDPVNIKDKLIPYDVIQYVPSDMAVGQMFLPQNAYQSQDINNQILPWTTKNLMKIN